MSRSVGSRVPRRRRVGVVAVVVGLLIFLMTPATVALSTPGSNPRPARLQNATLSLVKVVDNTNGGTDLASAWTLTATGPTTLSGSGGFALRTVEAGTYQLSESGPTTNYTASDWSCQSGSATPTATPSASSSATPTTTTSSITIPVGARVTCTITNTYNSTTSPTTSPTTGDANLELVKEVVNTGGGEAIASDWTLTASGPETLSGEGSASGTVSSGTYTLSESGGPDSYSASSWSCQNDTDTPITTSSEIAVPAGADMRCEITNTYQSDNGDATLELVKEVVNTGGGTATATDWTLSASGPTSLSGSGSASGDVPAGTYTLSESGGPTDYRASDWNCQNGTDTPKKVESQIKVPAGADMRCEITNTYGALPPTGGPGLLPIMLGVLLLAGAGTSLLVGRRLRP
jgi:large repetitive protein